MNIIANVIGPTINDDGTLDLYCSIGFVQGVIATNFGTHIAITPPAVLTATSLNQAIQQAISDYVNINYSTTTTFSDVILFSGATTA